MNIRIGPGSKMSPLGYETSGGGGINQTRWLIDKVKKSPTTVRTFDVVSNVIKAADPDQPSLVNTLAKELVSCLHLISEQTLPLVELKRPEKAEELVTTAASDFIELANLIKSPKMDADFVDFIVDVMLNALSLHSEENYRHSAIVTFRSAAIAKEMKIPEKEVRWLKTAGALHDIGKLGVSERILSRKGINENEKQLIDQHLVIGVYLLQKISWLKHVVIIVRHHHANPLFDSLFKPEILGEELYSLAQILRAVDILDGLTSDRSYKGEKEYRRFDGRAIKTFTMGEAFEALQEEECREDVIVALRDVVKNGATYIRNIGSFFPQREVKFILPGIEYLIEKEYPSASFKMPSA